MAIDASIFQNVQTPQINIPSPLDTAQKAMQLSTLGMQQMQMARQMRTQSAMQDALMRNTDANGNLDQQGALSSLGQTNPQAAMTLGEQFAQTNKATAEAQAAKVDAAQKTLSFTVPSMHYLAGLPEDQRSAAYPAVMKQLSDAGVNISKMPSQYDPGLFRQIYSMTDQIGSQMKDFLANQGAQASTAKTNAEAGAIPSQVAKNQAETTSAYASAAKAQSETYPHQPMPSGQVSDPALLVPNQVPKDRQAEALKEIKNAQDINKLSPQIMAAFQRGSSRNPVIAAQGQREFEGLINTTVQETEGTARKAAFDSIHRTMTPSGVTALPGENDARARTVMEYLQSKSSAPTARAYGIDLSKFPSTAPYQAPTNAASQPSVSSSLGAASAPAQSQYRAAGSTVSSDQVAQYAMKHGMTAAGAKSFLKGKGYVIGN